MRRIFSCLLILSFVTVPVLLGTEYYVNGNTGNDNNNGQSVGSAWKSITKANLTLTAGDTVYIMAGTYNTNDGNAVINPDNNGSAGNPITYMNYDNDVVYIRGQRYGALLNKNYITIDGLRLEESSQASAVMECGVSLGTNVHHIIVQNCIISKTDETVGAVGDLMGIRIGQSSTYCQFKNNTITYIGSNSLTGAGNGIKFQSTGGICNAQSNLVEGNTIGYVSHDPIQVMGKYNIIRGNTIQNPWHRGLEILADNNSSTAQYNVIEDNIIHNCGDGGESVWYNEGMAVWGIKCIIRRNRIYSNLGVGIKFQSKNSRYCKNNKVYHNVFYGNGTQHSGNWTVGLLFDETESGSTMDGMVVKNNINYSNYRDGVTYVTYALAGDQTYSNNHWDSNGNPDFINEGDHNFHLQSNSPCIETGTFLVQTRSSGSGTQISVDDASFFSSGFGITQGDTIQLEGQLETARITNINYSTNTIIVNSSLSWYSGQGVSLIYSGYAPDIGAFEYTGSVPDPLVANASGSPGIGYIPLTVNFTGSASGGVPPYSYSWTFGDGGSSTSQNPSHTYTQAGDFTATLTVTDNASNHDSDSIIIHASESSLIASIEASTTSGVAPLTVNFTGSASGGTPPYSYYWQFRDGGTSTSQNPSHTYSQPGNYSAKVTVTDSADNQDSEWLEINVYTQNPNFILSISSSTGSPAPGSGGTVDPPAGDYEYSLGTNVQIEATPNSNYRFSRWTGDINDAYIGNAQFTLTMDADKSISAKFCTRCGDVSGDLAISPIDAQLIFDIFLGVLSDPTLCQRENADVNDDGTKNNPNVTPYDAQAIFDFYLGKSGLPGDCSCNSRTSSSGPLMTMTLGKEYPEVNLFVQDPLTLPGGDEILVPVMIDSSIRLESFGFDLAFDSESFEFVGVTRAELTEDFIQVGANVVEDGVLRVGGYRDQTYEDCSPGELVILIFRVKREIEEPTAFQIFKTYDDLKNATVDSGRETLIR